MHARKRSTEQDDLRALPKTEFVTVRIVEQREDAADFLFGWSSRHTFRIKVFDCGLDVAYPQTQPRIAGAFDLLVFMRGNQFEQNSVHIEPSDVTARLNRESQNVAVERNRFFHVFHVVVDRVEGKLKGGVCHKEDLPQRKSTAVGEGWEGRHSQETPETLALTARQRFSPTFPFSEDPGQMPCGHSAVRVS